MKQSYSLNTYVSTTHSRGSIVGRQSQKDYTNYTINGMETSVWVKDNEVEYQ